MTYETLNLCPDCFSFQYDGKICPQCGYTVRKGNHSILQPGVMLGKRYYIGHELGIGGFGITYKAYDLLYREVCAIKEFAPSGLAIRSSENHSMVVTGSQNQVRFQHGLHRFIEEAQMLKRLEKEHGVTQVKECFKENQTAYFVMEYLDGQSLKRLVQGMKGNLNPKDITRIIMDVGKVMGVIHRKTGILHRDISPENIFVLKDGTVKIIDFGSARQVVMDGNQEFSVEFKRGFAPPEQYTRTGNQGTYTDVYALACTYYYALTGVKIPDAMERLDGKNYVPLHIIRPDTPVFISEAVDRALVLDYHNRTQTMEAFIREIGDVRKQTLQTSRAEGKKAAAYLEIVAGSHAGTKWKIPVNTKVFIGRSVRQSNIIIEDNPLISKVHCCIIFDQRKREFLLEDFSTNGVLLDGKRIRKNERYHCGAKVEFALANYNCMVRAEVVYE